MVLQGMPDKQIAHALGISIHTEKEYLHTIYGKMGVCSRGELIVRLLTSASQPADADANVPPPHP